MKVSNSLKSVMSNYYTISDEKFAETEEYVSKFMGETKLSQGKFDALVSFVYRVGEGYSKRLLVNVRKNPNANVSAEFTKFCESKEDVMMSKEEACMYENM